YSRLLPEQCHRRPCSTRWILRPATRSGRAATRSPLLLPPAYPPAPASSSSSRTTTRSGRSAFLCRTDPVSSRRRKGAENFYGFSETGGTRLQPCLRLGDRVSGLHAGSSARWSREGTDAAHLQPVS